MAKRQFYTMDQLVDSVKAYALEHYEDGGWDVIVEAWTDAMIADLLRGNYSTKTSRCRSPKGAIRRVRNDAVSIYCDYQADARNSAF